MRYTEIMPSDHHKTMEAYELISGYVTHGSLSLGNEFNDWFDKLMQLLPRPRSSMLLYRVLNFSDDQISQIQSGSLVLEARRYSSWTKSKDALDRLLYDRRRDDSTLVVIRATVPGNDIVVDVAAFYRSNHLTGDTFFDEWSRYVRPEQEVIVRQNDPLTITPDMVMEIVGPQKLSERVPHVGEWFEASDGTEEQIASVADPESDTGVFEITTKFSDRTYVRLNRQSKWVEVDR